MAADCPFLPHAQPVEFVQWALRHQGYDGLQSALHKSLLVQFEGQPAPRYPSEAAAAIMAYVCQALLLTCGVKVGAGHAGEITVAHEDIVPTVCAWMDECVNLEDWVEPLLLGPDIRCRGRKYRGAVSAPPPRLLLMPALQHPMELHMKIAHRLPTMTTIWTTSRHRGSTVASRLASPRTGWTPMPSMLNSAACDAVFSIAS
jgi:hypothetical protein